MNNIADEILLRLEKLRIGYPGHALGGAIEAEIPVGVKLGVIGGNGSGKTTFVRTLLGLTKPLFGKFHWGAKARFSYVPQEHQINNLFPLTVRDLLKMGAPATLTRWRGSTAAFHSAAAKAMALMEITGLSNRLVRDLSGGQRQRALIARSLIGEPNVIIMDEPFNSLDYRSKEKLWELLERLGKESHISVILIDHDLNRIVNHVDWLILLGADRCWCGPASGILTELNLSLAFGVPVKIIRDRFRASADVTNPDAQLREKDANLQVYFP